MNYTELIAAVADIVENPFTPGQLETFVRQAEQKIYNSVQLPSLRKSVTGVAAAGSPYLSAPDDFLSVYSVAIIDSGAYTYLINKDADFIRQVYPNPNDTARPQYYAIFGPVTAPGNPPTITTGLGFILGPTPNLAYGVELHYFYYPESIVTAGTTWLGDNYDSVLLNGALVEANRFIKGTEEMTALYDKMYIESMSLLKNLGDGKQRQDTYRSGQVRNQVR